jgi:hypothetical protein
MLITSVGVALCDVEQELYLSSIHLNTKRLQLHLTPTYEATPDTFPVMENSYLTGDLLNQKFVTCSTNALQSTKSALRFSLRRALYVVGICRPFPQCLTRRLPLRHFAALLLHTE